MTVICNLSGVDIKEKTVQPPVAAEEELAEEMVDAGAAEEESAEETEDEEFE